MKNLRWLERFLILTLVVGMLFPQWVAAQGDEEEPTPEEIEAELNELARLTHIIDVRDPGSTLWVGGMMGVPELATEMQAGDVVEALSFETFDGETFSPETLERPVILNFWASWCGPCRMEFPEIVNFAENDMENADLWFINTADTSYEDAVAFLETVEIGDIPSYIDPDDTLAKTLGIVGYPSSILLNTDGTILISRTGTITPGILHFFDLVAKYPDLGEFDPESVAEDEFHAQVAEVDLTLAEALSSGTTLEGTIDREAWHQVYSYEGTADEALTIYMEAEQIEGDDLALMPYLVLLDAEGQILAENNLGGGYAPAAQIDFTLPDDGLYYVVATRFLEAEGLSSGTFTLTFDAE